MTPRKYLLLAALAVCLAAPFPGQTVEADATRDRRIAIWGSSVANGTGDELGRGGYAGRLETLLESRGWEVFNQSRGGDNTIKITGRFGPSAKPDADTDYLTSVDPGFVVIGLSLGNEGLAQCRLGQVERCSRTRAEAEAIFQQFADGLQRLIARSHAAGITPIVTLPYARGDFSEREYAYTRRMNLLINSWDVPSINLLGAIDDGHGHWARGFWGDPYHPNAAGHTEMLHAVVPTLFAALRAGKTAPARPARNGFARLHGDTLSPIAFEVKDTMRSFSFSFAVRPHDDGVIAAVSGQTLNHEYSIYRRSFGDFEWDSESIELTPGGDRFLATLGIINGRLIYTSSDGNAVSAALRPVTDAWHQVTVTHYVARGETLLYADGNLIGSVEERLQPESFTLGGPGKVASDDKSARADYKALMLHRAGMNADEVAALHDGVMLQASLELYAPLASSAENLAQSLSRIHIEPSAVVFKPDSK